jgi:hypothetical protein
MTEVLKSQNDDLSGLIDDLNAVTQPQKNKLQPIKETIYQERQRIGAVVEAVSKEEQKLKVTQMAAPEILRAIVVFSHAILEESLRKILRLGLNSASSEVLDSVPLIGISQIGRPKKFGLGELNKHRGKAVDELIRESIDEYLDQISFSSTRIIVGWLEQIGIDKTKIEKYLPYLDQMITRRHKIVHKADLVEDAESYQTSSITFQEVELWANAVILFLHEITSLTVTLDKKEYDQLEALRQSFFNQYKTQDQ